MEEENKVWDIEKGDFIKTPKEMIDFFNEIEKICKKYNFSISHEDRHGAFIIESYSDNGMSWLRSASKGYEEIEPWEQF